MDALEKQGRHTKHWIFSALFHLFKHQEDFFLIWGDFRSSGLGAAALYRNEIKSADYVRVGNYLSIPSMDFFFTDSESLYQDSNIKIPMIRQRKSS